MGATGAGAGDATGMGPIKVEAIGGRIRVGVTGVASMMVGVTTDGMSRVGASPVGSTRLGPP